MCLVSLVLHGFIMSLYFNLDLFDDVVHIGWQNNHALGSWWRNNVTSKKTDLLCQQWVVKQMILCFPIVKMPAKNMKSSRKLARALLGKTKLWKVETYVLRWKLSWSVEWLATRKSCVGLSTVNFVIDNSKPSLCTSNIDSTNQPQSIVCWDSWSFVIWVWNTHRIHHQRWLFQNELRVILTISTLYGIKNPILSYYDSYCVVYKYQKLPL